MGVTAATAEDARRAIDGGAERIVVPLGRCGQPLDEPALLAVAAATQGRVPTAIWSRGDAAEDDRALRTLKADHLFLERYRLPATRSGIESWAVLPWPGSEPTELERLASRGFSGIVLGHLPQTRALASGAADLQRIMSLARAHRLAVGIGGAIEPPDIPRLLAFAPDLLVFDADLRRAGCREADLDAERLRFAQTLIAQSSSQASDLDLEPIGHDRIFIRDWIVSIPVGAYAWESAPQRVRFDVEVEIAGTRSRASDMRDVVSYDLVIDAIARMTSRHVELVETLAADVAAAILAHPRAVSVEISVEKLDLGPGSLGCRLKRRRRQGV